MTKTNMVIRIAKTEGVMLALYGICRDLVIGCSVDEDKDGKLGAVVADAIGMLSEVYDELGIGSQEAVMEIVRELRNIHVTLVFMNAALWLILFCKRCYSYTDGIKDAIKELISLIRSRW